MPPTNYNALTRRLFGDQNQNQPESYQNKLQELISLQGGGGQGLRMNPNALGVRPPTPRPQRQAGGHEESGSHAGHSHGKRGAADLARYGGAMRNVRGINVNASIADRVDQMLAAASQSGLNLTGGGYRDPATQRRLYNAWRAGTYRVPAVARPGSSRHEYGLAIDFSNLSNAGFNWLKQNAARYGFYNLPSERWHWSVDGR